MPRLSMAEVRRARAHEQANDPVWVAQAIEDGVSAELNELRARVTALPLHEMRYVTGMYSGEYGDRGEWGCAIWKVLQNGKRGRPSGSKDVKPRSKRRSKAEMAAAKKEGRKRKKKTEGNENSLHASGELEAGWINDLDKWLDEFVPLARQLPQAGQPPALESAVDRAVDPAV